MIPAYAKNLEEKIIEITEFFLTFHCGLLLSQYFIGHIQLTL